MSMWNNLIWRAAKILSGHPKDPAIAAMFGGGSMSSAGIDVNEKNALQSSAVYACIRVLAETVAHVPLIMYRRTDKGRMRAVDHPWYRPLHTQPNAWMTSFAWREQQMAHLCLRGVGYSRIGLSKGRRTLAPLNPDRTTAHLHQDGTLSYEYQPVNGPSQILLQEEVLRLPFMIIDGIKPVTPIQAQRETIGTALATMDYAGRFFKNDTRSASWIEVPNGFKDKTARADFRKDWQEAQSGANRGKTPVMEGGMKIHELGMSGNDAQLLESRNASVIDIARIYRVQPHMIGALERATNNNVEQQGMDFVVHTMMPWFVRIEQALAMDLLTPAEQDEYYFQFLVDGLLRGDSKSRAEFYSKLFGMGSLSQNEIRERENLDPLPDGKGNSFFVPLNMISVNGKQPADPKQPANPADDETK